MRTQLAMWGNSLALRIPKALARTIHAVAGCDVTVRRMVRSWFAPLRRTALMISSRGSHPITGMPRSIQRRRLVTRSLGRTPRRAKSDILPALFRRAVLRGG
jgi:hypothetical protein